jgi:SAM-dependent methyltransferase
LTGNSDQHGDNSDRYRDGDYLARNPTWHDEDSAWKVSHITSILRRNRIDPLSICEVGCGGGGIVQLLAQSFPTAAVCGYEISPQALGTCRARPPLANLSFHAGSPFDEASRYEVMMAIDVVEHVEDPFTFVRSMAALSGWQLFHVPLDMNALSVGRGWVIRDARANIGHLHYFNRDTILSLLAECGLEVVDSFYTPWAIDQSSKTLKKRLAALPRRVGFAVAPDLVVRLVGGWSLMILARNRM